MKTKFAIGCLVQWYEIEIVSEYIDSLKESIDNYDGDVIIDFTLNINQDCEQIDISYITMENIVDKFKKLIKPLNCEYRVNTDFLMIAGYRRWFFDTYCTEVDVLVQGETDAILPRQMFEILHMLHQQVCKQTPKYLATFGICKMWDNSWKPLEHVDFTDKPFVDGDEKNWWQLRYTMTKDEMNSFNDKVEDLLITTISPHKFNGCGLVMSSEVIKSGVNIPRGAFFIDDTALNIMVNKLLPNIPQYHFKNILLVHNRKHPNKRMYILGETAEYIDDKRKQQNWYTLANEYSKYNDANIFNPNTRFYTWEDVQNKIKENQ